MPSCSCDGDYERWVEPADDFAPLSTKRSRRCRSCERKIAVGENALEFQCFRLPEFDYEENRFPDGVPLADGYLCESCGEIWMNLSELGYCLTLGSDMREELAEYWEMTGFDPGKYAEAQNVQ